MRGLIRRSCVPSRIELWNSRGTHADLCTRSFGQTTYSRGERRARVDEAMRISPACLFNTDGLLHTAASLARSSEGIVAAFGLSLIPKAARSLLRTSAILSTVDGYYASNLACCPCFAINETAFLSKETKVSAPSQLPS
jgi:hypothetical protein